MTLHFLNDVANDAESTQTSKLPHNRQFEECLTMGKLINILCTISLAISYVSHLFELIFVQCRSISIAMTRTGS